MELPSVCDVARSYIADGGVSDRVETVSIDMFREEWPPSYDGMFFSNVFHDWDVETNLFLARRAYEALPPGGRIFLHEMLLARTAPAQSRQRRFRYSCSWDARPSVFLQRVAPDPHERGVRRHPHAPELWVLLGRERPKGVVLERGNVQRTIARHPARTNVNSTFGHYTDDRAAKPYWLILSEV